MEKLQLGVAGLGHGATLLQANTPAGRHLPLRVTAVCDIDAARARQAAERYDVPVSPPTWMSWWRARSWT